MEDSKLVIKQIDGTLAARLIVSGANSLSGDRGKIDALNVFPVPDGDTGTNMSLTMIEAAKKAEESGSKNVSDVFSSCASGALRGARGNSGVILSQLIRGISKYIDSKNYIDAVDVANAFDIAVKTAYGAVMKPKEGTILTVASSCAKAAHEAAEKTGDIGELLKHVINEAEITLSKTPEMLPELKEAGVVDSGGMGLISVLKGALLYIETGNYKGLNNLDMTQEKVNVPVYTEQKNIKFGYCTEFFIMSSNPNENVVNNLSDYLLSIGDSLMVVSDKDVIKVHVHTNHPGLVIEKALNYGALNNIKIDNMRIQHSSKIDFLNGKFEEEPKEIGFVSVSNGEGFYGIFKDIGVDCIVDGGQTMNPSSDDILNAIKNVNAKNIFVLPNNKNVVLSCHQAAEMCKEKNVSVILTNNILQGISAIINCGEFSDAEEAKESLNYGKDIIKSLYVASSVRDTSSNGVSIKKGDFIGAIDGEIILCDKNLENCVEKLVERAVGDDTEVIAVYYGRDVDKEDAEKLYNNIKNSFPDCETELHFGGQFVYYYMISVE